MVSWTQSERECVCCRGTLNMNFPPYPAGRRRSKRAHTTPFLNEFDALHAGHAFYMLLGFRHRR